jgi:hypothetical protein
VILVSGSPQPAIDQTYLFNALQTLGSSFVGVTQLPSTVTDKEVKPSTFCHEVAFWLRVIQSEENGARPAGHLLAHLQTHVLTNRSEESFLHPRLCLGNLSCGCRGTWFDEWPCVRGSVAWPPDNASWQVSEPLTQRDFSAAKC